MINKRISVRYNTRAQAWEWFISLYDEGTLLTVIDTGTNASMQGARDEANKASKAIKLEQVNHV